MSIVWGTRRHNQQHPQQHYYQRPCVSSGQRHRQLLLLHHQQGVSPPGGSRMTTTLPTPRCLRKVRADASSAHHQSVGSPPPHGTPRCRRYCCAVVVTAAPCMRRRLLLLHPRGCACCHLLLLLVTAVVVATATVPRAVREITARRAGALCGAAASAGVLDVSSFVSDGGVRRNSSSRSHQHQRTPQAAVRLADHPQRVAVLHEQAPAPCRAQVPTTGQSLRIAAPALLSSRVR